jgi:DNA (cytosine-5)-methyltransferase 1
MRALDLFAGAGGWTVACRKLGIIETGVENMPEAVATREANRMYTAFLDVYDRWDHTDRLGLWMPTYELLIASPPCPTFSASGKGHGRRAIPEIIAAIEAGIYKRPHELFALGAAIDPKSALVLVPLAYIWRDMPSLIALEQVPSVLPIWQAYAEVLRSWGYSVAVDVLNAEQYGVPQTRRRAILVAQLEGEAALPTPTHSRFYANKPERLDPGVEKWVSMADALGFQPDDLVGFARAAETDPSLPATRLASIEVGGKSYRSRDLRPAAYPAQNLTEKSRSWKRMAYIGHSRPHSRNPERVKERQIRDAGLPAPTIMAGSRGVRWTDGELLTVQEAATLQTFPEGFQFAGSKTKQFLQIGNAVPPLLAEAILKELIA